MKLIHTTVNIRLRGISRVFVGYLLNIDRTTIRNIASKPPSGRQQIPRKIKQIANARWLFVVAKKKMMLPEPAITIDAFVNCKYPKSGAHIIPRMINLSARVFLTVELDLLRQTWNKYDNAQACEPNMTIGYQAMLGARP